MEALHQYLRFTKIYKALVSLPKRQQAYLLLLINAFLWGIIPPLAKAGYQFLSPTQILFWRFLLAFLLFLPFAVRYCKNHPLTNYSRLILLSLLGTPLTLYPLYEGLKFTTSFEASLLSALGPLFIILGGWIFLHEKLSNQEKVGAYLAFLGTLIVTFADGSNKGLSLSNGNLLIILSNVIWTVYLLLAKKYKLDPIHASIVSYFTSTIFFGLACLLTHQSLTSSSLLRPQVTFLILYLGILGSIVAFWAYNRAQNLVEASEAAIFTYLHPVFALPLSFFWLKESITLPVVIALILIIVGVYLSESRRRVLK